jgi:protein-histidine pros-kinase
MAGDSERCLEAGMDAYLSKPLARELLLKTIASIVEKSDTVASASIPASSFNGPTLLDNLDGDIVLLEQVTTLFKQNTPTYLGQIHHSIMRRDGPALEKWVHTLLGSLGIVGAHRATDIAMTIQVAARSQEFEEAKRLLPELENEISRTYDVIASRS